MFRFSGDLDGAWAVRAAVSQLIENAPSRARWTSAGVVFSAKLKPTASGPASDLFQPCRRFHPHFRRQTRTIAWDLPPLAVTGYVAS